MTFDYDVAVLGGGPGGYQAAIRCAQYGLKTALIEARELGGTCLNRGCIPTKALLEGARAYEQALGAQVFGVRAKEVTIDYAALHAYKNRQVTKLRMGVEGLEKAWGVDVLRGQGAMLSAHELSLGERTLTAGSVILAMGSEPARPPIPGIEHAMTSDDVLSDATLPASAVIIGGGVIGMEFATLLSTLGARVTVLEMTDDILPGMDEAITSALKAALKRAKCDVLTGARVTAVEENGTVLYEHGGKACTVSGERVIVCTGRKPRTRDAGLENAGVAVQRGYVTTDDRMRTNVHHIYAVGDITGRAQLAHAAGEQGLTAAANCAGGDEKYDDTCIPACVYTHPEIATVGLSERAARAAGYAVAVGSYNVAANGRSSVMNERVGFARIVTDSVSGRVLGAQLMAPRATDMISEITAVMRKRGTAADLARTVHPHPTVSEIIMEAAADAMGLCVHAAPKRAAT